MKRTTATRRSAARRRPAPKPGKRCIPGPADLFRVSLKKSGQEFLHGTINASAFAFFRTCERGEIVPGT